MKLKYKILWIEDDKGWVESEIEFIENYLKKYGFVLEYENPEKYKEYDFSEFDIIVVDYILADKELGQDVIKKIRSKEMYTEILFYSQVGEGKLRKIIAEIEELDGIYCASKDNCVEKLKGLIYTTIRKTQDLNNLRGLVMAETGELDEMMREIIKLLAKNKKVKNDRILKKKEKLCEKYKSLIKQLGEYKLPNDFLKLVDSKHFNSHFLYTTLSSFSKCERNNIEKKQIIPYENEIINPRNDLAHKNEFEKLLEKDFAQIRKDIQKYKQLFQEIIDELNA